LSLLFSPAVPATNHRVRLEALMCGLNGNPNVQAISVTVFDGSQKAWAAQANETASRARLVFLDRSGGLMGEYFFTNNPPAGANTVLLATPAFAALSHAPVPDVLIPDGILAPDSGQVCFTGNAANSNAFDVTLCLSYGRFSADTHGAGPPAPALVITSAPLALVRFTNNGPLAFGEMTSRNADFRLAPPCFTNTQGQGFCLAPAVSQFAADRGRLYFFTHVIGATSSVPLTVAFTNGSALALAAVGRIAVEDGDTDSFALVADTGEAFLAPGRARRVEVAFQPRTPGFKRSWLRGYGTDGARVVEVELTGIGIPAGPCVAPDPYAARARDPAADAEWVTTDFVYTGNLGGATRDGGASCGLSGTSSDVWYRYLAGGEGTLVVSLAGSTYDTVLSAHRSAPGTVENEIACNDDYEPFGVQSRLELPVTFAQEVLLRVSGFRGAAGSFQMQLTGPPLLDFDRNRNGLDDRCELDFGDAPAPYPTRRAEDGARHAPDATRRLGTRLDTETDGAPDPLARGDDAAGSVNDEDGVRFPSLFVAGRTGAVEIAVSGGGWLQGWVDWNADGDWADEGEQIFRDLPLTNGVFTLAVPLPAEAVPTPLTFARFRFSSVAGLGCIGPAPDGEVEDYALEILAPDAPPAHAAVRFNALMAGWNGDASIQFIELEARDETEKLWGPNGPESTGRALLEFADAAERVTGRFVFPSKAPAGSNTVLLATRAFADATGLAPDFVMPAELVPINGRVTFRNNPENPRLAGMAVTLRYGTGSVHGETLPILGAASLVRGREVPFGTNDESAFHRAAPAPRNTRGETVALTNASSLEQGRALFLRETFRGNGRTCASCHRPGRDQFGLSPATVAGLPTDDPLFVHENNLHTLRLARASSPGDLRGRITGTTGMGTILAGSGAEYLVIGGAALTGTVRDDSRNAGEVATITPDDLNGPNPINHSPHGLELSTWLRGPRALVLVNNDGETNQEVFRAAPHLLNLASTAPYGLSGEFATLEDFSRGAVRQHFPRSLARVAGIDFREPTLEELSALSAFMLSLTHAADAGDHLDRYVTTAAQRRGRALFFGTEGKCSQCHAGPALATSDGSLPNTRAGRNDNFDTGVANLEGNEGLPTEPPGLPPHGSNRRFNTPTLLGVRLTAPYFHNNSAVTLREAVEFYASAAFSNSPAGQLTGPIPAAADHAQTDDLVAFLEALVALPVTFPRRLEFQSPADGPLSVFVTNVGMRSLSIRATSLTGPDPDGFLVTAIADLPLLAPGGVARIDVLYTPFDFDAKSATLEIAAEEAGGLGAFQFGIDLFGPKRSSFAVLPAVLNFGEVPLGTTAVARLMVTNVSGVPLSGGAGTIDEGPFGFLSGIPFDLEPDGVSDIQIQFVPQQLGFFTNTLFFVAASGGFSINEVTGRGVSPARPLRWFNPERVTGNRLRLRLGNADGTAIAPDRPARLELLTTTNLFVPSEKWVPWMQGGSWTNGVIVFDTAIDTNVPQQFFQARERPWAR
jgi:cytochrome c peroxidase